MNTSRRTFSRMVIAGAVASSFGLRSWGGAPKVGEAFPDLSKEALEGTVPDLAGKVVVVDFWASWCGPCKKVLTVLKELHKEYGPKGVVFLAVSLDEKKADMNAFLKRNPLPFAVVRDPKGLLAEKVVESLPWGYVLGRDGKVRGVHEGETSLKEYRAELDELLK